MIKICISRQALAAKDYKQRKTIKKSYSEKHSDYALLEMLETLKKRR